MTEAAAAAGRVIAQRYRLVRQLGEGGMGSVWEAEHLTLSAPVAVKLISPAIAQSPEALNRFNREAKAAAALRSSHVVQIFDYGVDAGVPFIVMEMLHGESLAERLERNGKLSLAETADVMRQVARAMARAHAMQIVHRDLKPDNIFIVREDERDIVKILDFGIAKSTTAPYATSGVATRSGALLGTPYYMSPEQAEGGKDIDYRADLWAMGVIAFECMTGARPFDHESLGGLLLQICTKPLPVPSEVAEVPPGFDQWFATAVARLRQERFQSAGDLAEGLVQLLDPTSDAARAGRVSRASSLPDGDAGARASAPSTAKSKTGWVLAGAVLVAGAIAAIALGVGAEPQATPAASDSSESTGSTADPPRDPREDTAVKPVAAPPADGSVQVTPVDSAPEPELAVSAATQEHQTEKRKPAPKKKARKVVQPVPVPHRAAQPKPVPPAPREPKRKHDLGI